MDITVITSFVGERARFADLEIKNLDLKNENEVQNAIKTLEALPKIYKGINTLNELIDSKNQKILPHDSQSNHQSK